MPFIKILFTVSSLEGPRAISRLDLKWFHEIGYRRIVLVHREILQPRRKDQSKEAWRGFLSGAWAGMGQDK